MDGRPVIFDGTLGRALVVVVFLFAVGATCLGAEEAPYTRGVLIRFQGEINPRTKFYIDHKLDEARSLGADLVVIEIDSLGGYVDESTTIARRLSKIDWAHTVAFVPNKAISGAAIISLGCDEIIMAPDALLGDAGAVYFDETDWAFRYVPEKYLKHLKEEVRRLAEAKGRWPALAEALVNKDLVVYRVENRDTGEIAFMSEAELDADKPDRWINREPIRETKEKSFLEIDGERAVELQLARGNSANREDLKNRYKLERDFVIIEPGGLDTLVYVLNLWWVTVVLFGLGLVALYVEFSAPGIGVGGVTAGLCFALFFWSRFLGGTAGWLEVVLFISALTFLAVEVFVLPGFGIAGLSGALLLLASLVMAGQKGLIPETPAEFDALRNTLAAIVVSGVLSAVTAYVISTYLGVIPVLNHLALRPPPPEKLPRGNEGFADSTSGLLVNVGDLGVADSPLRPAGKARFGDCYLDVVTDGEFINRGSRLCISEIVGTRIVVREPQDG